MRVKPLGQAEVLAGAEEVGLVREVGDAHDQRVALPPSARIAVEHPDLRRQVRRSIHRNSAHEALALAEVDVDPDLAGRLHDAVHRAFVDRHRRAEAALHRRAVLGAVGSIHPLDVVGRRRLVPARRNGGAGYGRAPCRRAGRADTHVPRASVSRPPASSAGCGRRPGRQSARCGRRTNSCEGDSSDRCRRRPRPVPSRAATGRLAPAKTPPTLRPLWLRRASAPACQPTVRAARAA